MKRIHYSLLLIIGFPVFQLSNFNGNWKISSQESFFGDLPKETAAPQELKVEQAADHIQIDRTYPGMPLVQEDYKLDGTEVRTQSDADNTKTKHVAIQGNKLLVLSAFTTRQNNQDYAFNRKEIWSLEDGGKTLVMIRITVFTKGQERRDSIRAIYHRP